MNGRRASLWAASAIALVAALLSVVGAPSWLRLPFGLLLVVLLPGYGLVSIIDPRGHFDRLERFAIVLGTSLALTILVGLVVAQLPTGLNTTSWAASLGGLTLVANAVALRRCKGGEAQSRVRHVPPLKQSIAVALVAIGFYAVLGLALWITSASAPPAVDVSSSAVPETANVLQLWMLPDTGSPAGGVRIGVRNATSSTGNYRLRVTQGSQLLHESSLRLSPGEIRILSVQSSGDANYIVEAVLSDASGDTQLRRVTLWLER
ncbi:MAG: DUF1616 domain-containing protein [Coriobacteriia bacterium]|nr:DUF1616 domain-containing protein [Coriobacteriia bacterium]